MRRGREVLTGKVNFFRICSELLIEDETATLEFCVFLSFPNIVKTQVDTAL